MYVFQNQLSGTIPWFPQLTQLWAQENAFTGFDAIYPLMEYLEVLALYENSLTGALESTWTTPRLVYLDLGSNQLDGPVPSQLWDLPSLQSLILDDNLFDGMLPSTTPGGNAFQHVWLQSNRLTGAVPEVFGLTWTNLTTLLLDDNQFSGGNVGANQCSQWNRLERLETDCVVNCVCCTSVCTN